MAARFFTFIAIVCCLGGRLNPFATDICGANAFDWRQEAGFRKAGLKAPESGRVGFSRLSSVQTGIQLTNLLSESRHLTNQILLNGSGVAAGDVDGDGWCDLYFCGLDSPNALYRNLGNWRFQEITHSSGVACADLTSTGAAFADLDGDGDLDLIVNSVGGGTRIFRNNGQAQFTPMAEVNQGKGGMSIAVGDIDGDGFLDIYIANYRTSALMDMPNARATFKMVDGKMVVERVNGRLTTSPELTNRFVLNARGGIDELGEPDLLLRNLAGTNFAPIPFTGGNFTDEEGRAVEAPLLDWGLSAMFRDMNGDGLPDLYVCNDFDSPDRIWLNAGRGKFRALPALAMRKASQFSMGVEFADINRDGQDDFIVLDMLSRHHTERMTQLESPPVGDPSAISSRPQYGLNTVFLGRSDGAFAEVAQLSGLEASEWSWTPVFLDVDLDGWEDLLVSNGQERAARDVDVVEQLKRMRAQKRMSDAEIFQARKMFPRLDTANLAFRNRGDLTFEEVGEKWGFADRGVAHGMALADLDNDGDLDVAVSHLNDSPGIYRNETSAPRLAVRLKGRAPNTRGIGAKLFVRSGAVPSQSQEMICGGRYLSSDEPTRTFAAGSATNLLEIEVRWRSGQISILRNVAANQIIELDESAAQPLDARKDPAALDLKSASTPLFEDVSRRLAHVHVDEPFDDFARQRLLPNRLSQLGPGVTWFDVNEDGWDDLIIPSGKGGRLGVFQNNGRGEFKQDQTSPFAQAVTRDQTAVLGWQSADGPALLAATSNYEDGLSMGAAVRRYDLTRRTAGDLIAADESSAGPIAHADIDGDGDLDFFVGGRVVPGRYPEPASSRLFRNEAGKLSADAENNKLFAKLGLVSGAAFADLDGDGFAELVLACEWGPLRIFKNIRGQFAPWNPGLVWPANHGQSLGSRLRPAPQQATTLSSLTGWWNGVASGDFDGDGRLDLVASNWGRNTKYERHRGRSLRVHFGDLNRDGSIQIIETHFDPLLQRWVPDRQLGVLAGAMPFLGATFSTHRAFGQASIEQMLAGRLESAQMLEAGWLESTVFLNRGDRFEARSLPIEAQFAPAFGISVADLDGDGAEDIFLAQNFFATQPETPRYDAGRGLLLSGNGTGEFRAVPGQQSGIRVDGEQRGCALADFDADGRIDLAVSQNRGETKLYRNLSAKPGLRIRLIGEPANPLAIGAMVRLVFGDSMGPVRQVGSGSGYLSQDSPVIILAIPKAPRQVWVRWPGGLETRTELPGTGSLEIKIPSPPGR